ncbi:hypothetical protein CFAM422_012822 [Trichoderma lentiforme]|uniref:Uncharacterized protein n=1 Tax=Trichoderma lentiforme TaxID=1567552 RepID=A0A9P5C669_9HYPO|nr:hypothetical protein CFAM422_012822 [Trichoderma lentiforme]
MHFKLSLAAASVIIQALVAAIPFSSLPSTDIDPAVSDNFVNAQENDFLVDVPRGYEANGYLLKVIDQVKVYVAIRTPDLNSAAPTVLVPR